MNAYALARVSVRSAFFAAAVCLLFAPAASARVRSGPGPITQIELADGALTVVAGRGNQAMPFAAPTLLAADARGFAPFSEPARLADGGARLVQRGTVGGRDLASFFAEGAARMLQVTNGDGGVTQLEVRRFGSEFQITFLDRKLAVKQKAPGSAFVTGVDVLGDQSLRVALEPPAATSKVALSVGVVFPPLPPGASRQSAFVYATSGDTVDGGWVSEAGPEDSSGFAHMMVEPGTYTLRVVQLVDFETSADRTVRLTAPRGPAIEVAGSKGALVTYELPALPPLVDAEVRVENFGQFPASSSAPASVAVSLTGERLGYYLSAATHLVNPGTPTFTVKVPADDYNGSVYVSLPGSGSNSGGSSATFDVGRVSAGPSMILDLPSVVRVDATVIDPEFALFPSPNSRGIRPYHTVRFAGQTPDGRRYQGTGELIGFQRGFRIFAAQGAAGVKMSTFMISVGEELANFELSENDSATLIVSSPNETVVASDEGALDVTVPTIPAYVTLEGRVVDRQGRPLRDVAVSAHSAALQGFASGSYFTYVITDRNGRFRLRLLPGENYSIVANAPYR